MRPVSGKSLNDSARASRGGCSGRGASRAFDAEGPNLGPRPGVPYNRNVMSDADYLPRLTTRLADGLARLPADLRTRQAAWLAARQNPDGGWSGREGGSDLYYTGFALRGLAALGELTPEIAGRTADYLR